MSCWGSASAGGAMISSRCGRWAQGRVEPGRAGPSRAPLTPVPSSLPWAAAVRGAGGKRGAPHRRPEVKLGAVGKGRGGSAGKLIAGWARGLASLCPVLRLKTGPGALNLLFACHGH